MRIRELFEVETDIDELNYQMSNFVDLWKDSFKLRSEHYDGKRIRVIWWLMTVLILTVLVGVSLVIVAAFTVLDKAFTFMRYIVGVVMNTLVLVTCSPVSLLKFLADRNSRIVIVKE